MNATTPKRASSPHIAVFGWLWSQKAKLFGFGLTIAFVVLIAHNVDLAEVRLALGAANYTYVLPAATVTLLGYGLRTLRWKLILRPTKDIPLGRLFPVLIIGFATNNILPARVGEVARAYALGRKEGVSRTLGLSSVVLERILDGLTLVCFIAILSVFFPLPGWGADLARFAILVFAGATFLVALLLRKQELAFSVLKLICDRLPRQVGQRITGMAEGGVQGLQALRSWRQIAELSAISLAIWLAEGSSYLLILRSFSLPLDETRLLFAAILVLVVVNLGIMVPSAPGYIGTFHFFVVLALQAFEVGREIGLSVGLVSHAMQYVMITGLGLLFLWREQFSITTITKGDPASLAEGGPATEGC